MCDLKLCKDCKWCKINWIDRLFFGYRFANCDAPKTKVTNLVSGKETDGWKFCSTQRMLSNSGDNFSCDKEGKFFEPKK